MTYFKELNWSNIPGSYEYEVNTYEPEESPICSRCDADLSDPSEMLNLINNKLLCSCCATEVSWQEEREYEENIYKTEV